MEERATLGPEVLVRLERGTPRIEADPALFTYEDLAQMPDDLYRRELIEGELVVSPAPLTTHQVVVMNLGAILHAYVRRRHLGLVLPAPVDVRFSSTTVLEPDLVFVADENLSRVKNEYLEAPPDLVVEVISKGTRTRDRERKRAVYERYRVPHYWILDPFTKTLEELVLRRTRYALRTTLTGAKRFEPALFPGLKVSLGKVWT